MDMDIYILLSVICTAARAWYFSCLAWSRPHLPDVGLLIDEGEQALRSGRPGHRLLLAILVHARQICASIWPSEPCIIVFKNVLCSPHGGAARQESLTLCEPSNWTKQKYISVGWDRTIGLQQRSAWCRICWQERAEGGGPVGPAGIINCCNSPEYWWCKEVECEGPGEEGLKEGVLAPNFAHARSNAEPALPCCFHPDKSTPQLLGGHPHFTESGHGCCYSHFTWTAMPSTTKADCCVCRYACTSRDVLHKVDGLHPCVPCCGTYLTLRWISRS